MSDFYRAKIDFEFGGVKVRAGDVVPCHRAPWSSLLAFGGMYVETDDARHARAAVSLPVEEQQ